MLFKGLDLRGLQGFSKQYQRPFRPVGSILKALKRPLRPLRPTESFL
jgi:hypothetical protein